MKERVKSILKFIRRERTITKILSFTLCLVMVFYVIPSTIYTKAAELLENEDGAEAAPLTNIDSEQSEVETNNGVLFEDVSLREESAKHFHLEDGRYVAAQYNYPVHILDSNGEWQDIDNALVESGSEFTNSNARIKFAKKINGSTELFALHDGNTKLTLTLIDAVKGTVGEITNLTDTESDTELQKMMHLEKLSASVIYRDILDGVDLEYVAYSMNVKENIIVKEKKESYSYSFELKLNGLTPTLTESGDIEIRSDDTDGLTYIIPAPVVFDSEGAYAPSDRAYYSLTHENGKKYTLTVTVDSVWMNAEERAFPVTVDPAVMSSSSTAIDVNISSSNPDTVSNSGTEITVMTGSTTTMLMHWKMPTLPTVPLSAKIVDARITLVENTIYGVYVGAYDVLDDWDETLTWTKYINTSTPQGTLGNMVDYVYIEWPGAYEWNITKLAEEWYRGNNFGVAFKCIPKANTIAFFYSAEATSNQPSLTVTYKDMKGIESYWPISSHSAGIAGNGNINLANGNLVFTIPTLTTTDRIFSYTPTLVYDASMAGKLYYNQTSNLGVPSPFLARGFKLNISQTLKQITLDDSTYYYIYSDADGTEHFFYITDDGTFRDDDGLGLILTEESSTYISITDDSKTEKIFQKFGSIWQLNCIIDINGNNLFFTYSSGRVTKISLIPEDSNTAIDLLEFIYGNNGYLRMIYNPSARIAAVLRYSSTYAAPVSSNANAYLKQIDYAYGTSEVTTENWNVFIADETSLTNITVYDSAEYYYDSTGRLKESKNIKSNTSVKYLYTSNMLHTVTEYAYNIPGNSFYVNIYAEYSCIQGNGNDGRLGTADDIITNYVLDNYGRCTAVYSTPHDAKTVYGASTYMYDTQINSKNSVKQSFLMNGSAVNYIVNGSFEDLSLGMPIYWNQSGSVYSTPLTSVEGSFERSLTFAPTASYYASSTASIWQNLLLDADKYTLSMPIHFKNAEGVTGNVSILDYTTSEVIHTEDIVPTLTSGSTFFSTTFDVPYAAYGKSVVLEISFTSPRVESILPDIEITPEIEIDSVMLSRNLGADDFSLLEYGSFELTQRESDGVGISISSDYWVDESGNAVNITETYEDEGKVLLINNTTGGTKYAKQTIYTASNARLTECDEDGASEKDKQPHTFAVSGFARSYNALVDRFFGLKAEIVYYRGADSTDLTTTYYYGFSSENEAWQYTGGSFTLGYDQSGNSIGDYLCVKSITIYCDCSGHYGIIASFNDISVSYAGMHTVTKYTYTEDGRIESVTDGSDGKFYLYNSNGNVSKVADSRGNLVGYTYDAKNRVKTVLQSDYTYTGTGEYPYDSGDLFANMTVTNKYLTSYTYNNYGLLTNELSFTYTDDGSVNINEKYTESTYTYETSLTSKIFGALLSESHLPHSTNKYFYNADNGNLLASVSTGLGVGTTYSYDAAGRLLAVYPATYVSDTDTYTMVTGAENVEYTYNPQNRLSEISTESTTYTLLYDGFGNQSAIKAGNNTLATYEYGAFNGKLSQITYGNGHIVKYVYNDLEIVSEIWYNDDTEPAYEYEYTSDGKLLTLTDNLNGTVMAYKYDGDGRLTSSIEYNQTSGNTNLSTNIQYNDESYVSNISYVTPYRTGLYVISNTSSYGYEYDNEGKIIGEDISVGNSTGEVSYKYDGHNRLSSVDYSFDASSATGDEFNYTNEYTYYGTQYYTYPLVWEYVTNIQNGTTTNTTYHGFIYDVDGNITRTVQYYNDNIIGSWNYVYDDLSQLIREDNSQFRQTYVYEYDDAGNIISKTTYSIVYSDEITKAPLSVDTYGYSTSAWGDLLTSYNGTTITYDAIGNPLSYYNGSAYTFTWDGRRLATAVKGSDTMSFVYGEDGTRVSKTVNGVTTHYVYSRNLLISEYTDMETIVYIYDVNGSPIGFKYIANSYASNARDTYWYEKNLQGDIIAIYSASGTKLVAYKYDAWGNTIVTYSNNGANTTAVNNNLTYRGYYYDSDLSMYYLQNRYYDPVICRFINADGYVTTGQGLAGYNMFAYCGNNPVNRKDPTGQFWITALIITVVAVVCAVTLTSCSEEPTSDVGAAQPYVYMPGSDDPTSPNCYAYAIGSPVNEQPGQTSGCIPTRWNDVNDVGKSVEADLKAKGYTVREISGHDAKIYDNEFKIALRVGTQPYAYNAYTGQLYYDYHFMRQTNTGQWAEKHGYGGSSVLWDAGMTPDTIPWTLGGVPYYDSAIIYYAVGK